MALGEVKDEVKKSEELWGNSNHEALRDQQERDFGYWGPHEFKMPSEEGDWKSATSNSAKTLANKIITILSSSWCQLFIDYPDDGKKERKKIVNSEYLANGTIWLADRENTSVPSGKRIQDSLSTFATIKGGTVKSLLWYEEDKKVSCDIRVYDPEFCQWIEGEKEIDWFCHRAYVSRYYLERKYKDKPFGKAEPNGRYLLRTFWDEENWKLELGGEWVDEGHHGLGYIPVNIRATGPAPYIQSTVYEDTMKYSWMSCFANTRDIYDMESEALSIERSKALRSGRNMIAGEFNSDLGDPPKGLEKLGYGGKQRDDIILFDLAQGQKFGGMITPPDNKVIDDWLSRIKGMDIIGSIDPIAFGQMTRSGSGALAAELRSAALEFIGPFRGCVEADMVWLAEEGVRQFKSGKYSKVEVEGRDRKREKFHIDLSPTDVEEKHFDCELVADRLRDEMQELGAAIQEVSTGLNSRRGASIKHNITNDPDRAQDEIDEELAAQDPVLRYDKMAKYWKDQGNERMAQYFMALSAITIEKFVKQAMMEGLMPEEEPKPSVVSPQMQTANIATEPQRSI